MKVKLAIAAALTIVSSTSSVFADDAKTPAAVGAESNETQAGEPPPDAAPKVMKRRSTGMFASGIVLSSLGGLSIAIGAAYFAMESSTDASLQSAYDACEEANVILVESGASPGDCGSGPGEHDPWPGVAFLVGGVVGMAVGVPLAVSGGTKVPVTITRAGIEPVPGGAVAVVRGTF